VLLIFVALDLNLERIVTGYTDRHDGFVLYVKNSKVSFANLVGIFKGPQLFGANAGRAE
jgi:hypothetical protein